MITRCQVARLRGRKAPVELIRSDPIPIDPLQNFLAGFLQPFERRTRVYSLFIFVLAY